MASETAAAPAPSSLSIFDTLHLVDQNGVAVTSRSFQGRLVLLNFIFTHCTTTCPMQTEQISAVQRGLPPAVRDRLLLVSVSVDPEVDTPAALKAFGRLHHIDPKRWMLVTGAPAAVAQLATHFDSFALSSSGEGAGRHTTDVRLFDASGRLLQRYAGAPIDQERLSREVQQLAQQSAPALPGHS